MFNGRLVCIDLQKEYLFRCRGAIFNRPLIIRCHRTCGESGDVCRKRPDRSFGFASRMGEGGSGQLSIRADGSIESRDGVSGVEIRGDSVAWIEGS